MLTRFKPLVRYLLLFLVMGYVTQWMGINLYLTGIGQKQKLLTEIKESPLITLIQSKTGLLLSSFRIIASPRPYAVMIGIPNKPFMMLSSQLNQDFTDSEKEYVVLHETGHYQLHHTIKELIFFITFFIISCFIVRKLPLYIIPIIGIALGLFNIQYAMRSEYEADRFAVSHITDPKGMITVTEKFRNAHFPPLDDYSPLWPVLYRSTPYHVRIEMANKEIERRSKN
ncbi:MAG: M48 family metalloprotease [Candidatus Shapirobacteria bacterium]|jgi:Zn-dependent protease with chaperone function